MYIPDDVDIGAMYIDPNDYDPYWTRIEWARGINPPAEALYNLQTKRLNTSNISEVCQLWENQQLIAVVFVTPIRIKRQLIFQTPFWLNN